MFTLSVLITACSIYGKAVQGLIQPVSYLLTCTLFQSCVIKPCHSDSFVQAHLLGTYEHDGKRKARGGTAVS